MQHIFVTQGFAEQLPQLISPSGSETRADLHWYGHLVPTVSGDRIILLEANSRYCLVLTELVDDFEQFVQYFSEELTQTVLWLTGVTDKTRKRVTVSVENFCREVQIGVGLDYNVSADLFELACQLQFLLQETPTSSDLAGANQGLANRLNCVPKTNDDNQEVIPLEAFRDFWCQYLGVSPVNIDTSWQ